MIRILLKELPSKAWILNLPHPQPHVTFYIGMALYKGIHKLDSSQTFNGPTLRHDVAKVYFIFASLT